MGTSLFFALGLSPHDLWDLGVALSTHMVYLHLNSDFFLILIIVPSIRFLYGFFIHLKFNWSSLFLLPHPRDAPFLKHYLPYYSSFDFYNSIQHSFHLPPRKHDEGIDINTVNAGVIRLSKFREQKLLNVSFLAKHRYCTLDLTSPLFHFTHLHTIGPVNTMSKKWEEIVGPHNSLKIYLQVLVDGGFRYLLKSIITW